ncbi:MAG TPA: S4 domain-containing protein [Acidobacteriota bacterium]|nr:S4 domain-containing protein [Acidobacteriota bacterium]HQM62467.1 S4 domain-containing protein [Acidobacteriota bacterium]
MRLDMFLRVSRIIARRPLGKRLCDNGAVRVNGRTAKAAQEIRAGDIIEVDAPGARHRYRVERLPDGRNVARTEARELATLLDTERKDILD